MSALLRLVRKVSIAVLGVGLVAGGLVFHWRVGHGRSDWDWRLILLHADWDDGSVDDGSLDSCLAACQDQVRCEHRCRAER